MISFIMWSLTSFLFFLNFFDGKFYIIYCSGKRKLINICDNLPYPTLNVKDSKNGKAKDHDQLHVTCTSLIVLKRENYLQIFYTCPTFFFLLILSCLKFAIDILIQITKWTWKTTKIKKLTIMISFMWHHTLLIVWKRANFPIKKKKKRKFNSKICLVKL